MGRAWCGEVFGPVARKTREIGMPDGQRTAVLEALIRALQGNDWDTEGESLAEFGDDEAVVEAFRRCKVIIACGEEGLVDGEHAWCARERLPRGHDDGQHRSEFGETWPVIAGDPA